MKQTFISIIILVVAFLGIKFFTQYTETPTTIVAATFSDGTSSVPASFDTEANTVTFTHEATGEVTLPQAVSASGARYANEDESIVFWEHQGEVTITKDGVEVFRGGEQGTVNGEQEEIDDGEQTSEDGEQKGQNTQTASVSAELIGTWVWQKTEMNDDSEVVPTKTGAFTLTFAEDGRVSGTTDCNNFMGSATVEGSALSFGPLASTMMFCLGSQENVFTNALAQVSAYVFDAEGTLVLNLKMDSGGMHFTKQQ